jgi:hypothetical protein
MVGARLETKAMNSQEEANNPPQAAHSAPPPCLQSVPVSRGRCRTTLTTKSMVCAKCQKNEASVHVTTILYQGKDETIQLCKDCYTETARVPIFEPSKVEALSVIAGKCEFCGEEAFSGRRLAGEPTIYWCFECEAEYRRTFSELFFGEHREVMECVKTRSPFPPSFSPLQFQAWAAEAGQRVVQIMKERRQRV